MRRFRAIAIVAAVCMSFGTVSAEVPTVHSLITNVRVVDGTGAPARRASVRIQGDRIVEIGDLSPQKSEAVIDGAGHVLAPGFVDTHSHHDSELFEQPEALAAVSQGITTIIVGQDGSNGIPLPELFRRMRQVRVAVNVGAYVGHNGIRRAVMKKDFRRHATPKEIERMRQLVREGMLTGALGLSSGLEYDPGIYSSKEEVIALAREAAAAHGRYSSHMRSEDRRVWQALDELIEIGRATGMPVHVSHMKLAMTDWWGQAGRFIARMDEARAQGIDVTGDIYPYEYWESGLTVLFPDRDFENRASAEFALRSLATPDGLLMSSFTPDPSLAGKTVAQIARLRGTDAPTTLMDLIREAERSDGIAGVIGTSMSPADISTLIAWPHANICTDGSLDDRHPRGAGAMTRVLRQYVREQPLLTLEQAVAKLSATAAASAGIRDRGVIRPGMRADLVLFDPATVTDRATLAQPAALSIGIHRVWVNGQVVFENGRATAARPGMAVLREPQEAAVTAPIAGGASVGPALHDVVVRGGTIYDGSGKMPYAGDVVVDGDRIAYVGRTRGDRGRTEIDARDRAVTPGFINMLSWAVDSLLVDGRGQSDLRQGVTLEVFGEGSSMGPLNEAMKRARREQQGDIRYEVDWTTLGEYLERLEQRGVAPNVASFIGATTPRSYVLESRDVDPTSEQLGQMRGLVRGAMEEGALGVAASLIYVPGAFAETVELVALAEEAGRCGGIYVSHMRSEGDRLLEALDETIDIARRAGVPAEIYHLKAAGKQNWPKLEEAIRRIEQARAGGVRITADMYTYTAGATGLSASMPPWVQEGGLDAWIERLKDPKLRARVLADMRAPKSDWENLYRSAGGGRNVLLVEFKTSALKPLTGKTLAEVARTRNISAEEAAIDLVIEDHSRVEAVYFMMSEENVRRQIALPFMSFASDAPAPAASGVFLASNVHPRAYGTFARLLGKYVRDEKAITLEEAVRRLTSYPAANLGLRERGSLTEGNFADVVIFDPDTITDRATYEKPHQYATGVTHVLVNGKLALKDGEPTGAASGRVVRGRAWKGWSDGGCRASSRDWSWAR